MAATAADILTKTKNKVDDLGTSLTFFTYTSEAYDPDTGKVTPSGETQTPLKVVGPEGYSSHLVNGDTIEFGDLRCWLPAKNLAFTPDSVQRVDWGSDSYRIVSVSPIPYKGTVVLYELQLRGGK